MGSIIGFRIHGRGKAAASRHAARGGLLGLLAVLALAVCVACGNPAADDPADTPADTDEGSDVQAPAPGNGGTITASDVALSSVSLAWEAATDDVTAQADLLYRAYYSTSDNLGSVADCEANGTAAGTAAAAATSVVVTGLSVGTAYYFNVVVSDAAGNKAAYARLGQATRAVGFGDVTNVGGTVSVTAGAVGFTMICANNRDSVTYPTGADDSGSATLSRKLFAGETEVTYALFREVLQWAKDKGYLVETVGAGNEVSSTVLKYGGRYLYLFSGASSFLSYTGGTFFLNVGHGNYPAAYVSVYGAVMFCNWLTEMKDGSAANAVYDGLSAVADTWASMTIDESKTGYRLPSQVEWEYIARYRGSDATNVVAGYADPCFTKGNSASGATADVTDSAATAAVAVTNQAAPVAVKTVQPNALGLYDVCGGVWEWTSTVTSGTTYVNCGGSWYADKASASVTSTDPRSWGNRVDDLGFRLVKTW